MMATTIIDNLQKNNKKKSSLTYINATNTSRRSKIKQWKNFNFASKNHDKQRCRSKTIITHKVVSHLSRVKNLPNM